MTSLIVVTGIAMMGSWLIHTQAAVARRQAHSIDTKLSLYVAEAGIAEAAFQVSQGKSGNIGTEEDPARYGPGIYWVDATKFGDHEILLTSTARAGGSQFRVELKLIRNQNPVGKLGIFGDEGVVIGDRVLVDGYDSSLGTIDTQYKVVAGPPSTGDGAMVGSNGDIELLDGTAASDTFKTELDTSKAIADGDTMEPLPTTTTLNPELDTRYSLAEAGEWVTEPTIIGEATPGPEGLVLRNGGGTISSIGERNEPAILPEVVLPTDIPTSTAHVVMDGTDRVVSDVSISFASLTVDNGGKLFLKGPVVIMIDELHLLNSGHIHIDDSVGPVTFFVKEEVRALRGAMMSNVGGSAWGHGFHLIMPRPADPEDDDKLQLEVVGGMRGMIYAPGHRVTIPQTLRWYGSIVAKHVTIADGAWVSHDEALEVGGPAFPNLPRKLLWKAVPLGDELVGPPGAAPLFAAALAGATLEHGHKKTSESDLEVMYVDALGATTTYAGPAAGFDASTPSRILAVRWQDPDTMTFDAWTQPSGVSPDDVIVKWREKVKVEKAAL